MISGPFDAADVELVTSRTLFLVMGIFPLCLKISLCFVKSPLLHVNDNTMILERCHKPTGLIRRVAYMKTTVPVILDSIV